ncbi:MAG TPA: sensor histidine kinase [Candidatus Sulfopaludibacter sp.]|jgi:signal transduction histidine kinase|nr:sensor histidine kinase [Candidatus Sulfopaludibacter sp.]
MATNRSSPVLLVGFGMLIGLIVLSGITAGQRARIAYREISSLNDRYRTTDRNLNAVALGIYTMGLFARDYLLDPSSSHGAEYRSQLVAERASMEAEFRDLERVIRAEDRPRLIELRGELEAYWNALDPLFEWSSKEKAARSWTFLQREILPRRRAALSIAREVSKLTEANLDNEMREIDRNQTAMETFNKRMFVFTLLVGIGIAGVSVQRMAKLEKNADRQRIRTEAAEQELRRLSRQLVHALENDRKSISRELHDEVGQMLTALRMELRSLQDLRNSAEADFGEHLEAAKRLSEQSLRALRDMAMGLRPSMLDDLGLGSAIQWQARQFSKHTGIPVNARIENVPPRLPDRHRTCVYRFVQEALTNCARHSQATTIDVIVRSENQHLLVVVRDNGVGFDPSAVRGRGLGLIGLQERVRELDGSLCLKSEPLQGAELSAQIPLASETVEDEHSNSAG